MLKNMSIGRKLVTGVAAMFALTALLGIYGIVSLRSFKEHFDAASDETVRNIVQADTIVTANSEMISTQRGIILAAFSKDSSGFAKYQDTYKQSVQLIRTSLAGLRTTSRNPETEALKSEISSKVDEWRPLYDDVVAKAAGGDIKEADRIRRELTAPIYKILDKDARRLAAIEVQAMADSKSSLASQYALNLSLTSALVIAFVVLGVVVIVTVQGISNNLRSTVTELSEGADQVGRAAAQISSSSQVLANGSSQQAASLEETSASTEQINSMARRNSEGSQSAAQLVLQSQEKVSQANKALEGMVVAMGEINASSDKISKIIKVIDEIAFQTNILALNAAVEAARAGEAGMGFAVVADEVRNLAQRSAQAAKDTASLIEDSISKSNDGKSKVDQVAAAIRQITEQSSKLKVLIDEVSVGSTEQARGLEQVARAIVQMEQVTQGAAASAEESASAAEQLSAQSIAVKDILERLTGMVEGSHTGALRRR